MPWNSNNRQEHASVSEVICMKGGSLEERIAKAQVIKSEFEEHCPEMAALRNALIAEGMVNDSFASITSVETPSISYRRERDDPHHFTRQFAKASTVTQAEIEADVTRARQAQAEARHRERHARAVVAKKAIRK